MKKLTIIILFTTLNFSLLTFHSYSQWYQVNLPVSSQITRAQFVNQNTGWIMLYNRYLLKSTNSGVNWFIAADSSQHMFDFQFINDTLGYGFGKSGLNNLMLRTTNGGYNWIILQTTQQYMLSGFYFINADTGYINGFNMSYYTLRTTNGLQTIDLISSGAGGSPASIWFYKYPYNGNLCGYISGGGNLWRTTNSGYNWSQMNFSNYISSYSFINKDTGWVILMSSPRQILKTTNGGVNWVSQYSDPTGVLSPSNIFALDKYNIWSGIENYYYRIIRTTNGGTNWGNQNCQIPWPQVVYMYDSSFGFVWNNFSVNNLARTTNGGGPILPVNKISEKVPDNYELSQNYPNPFNAASNIKYHITKSSTINITIYDIKGNMVTKLVNTKKSPGTYQVLFDADNLPSGVYFYSLIADGIIIDTKRMLMIK